MDELDRSYDVVVIGGGAAGLSGALTLARSRRSVLVLDASEPRNAQAEGIHGLLGHDGVTPGEFIARGRAEVRMYGGHIATATVVRANQESNGFTVSVADGRSVRARRLLVTTGLVDELPDVPGIRERWGRDVIHCPYCHGWENRDRAIGVLASGPMSIHQALLFRQLSDDVVYFSHDTDLDADAESRLSSRGIRVIEGEVEGLDVVDDRIAGVLLRDGTRIERAVVVLSSRMVARAAFLADLGLHLVEHPSGAGEHIPSDSLGRTEVPSVWAAGNVTDISAQVGASAAAGALAAAQINADLVAEDTRNAVEARDFWEGFYGDKQRVWSGEPNDALVSHLGAMHPGTALELGCGEGADAIWLAHKGWRVTALDISATALNRAAERARSEGVEDLIEWRLQDLATWLPAGTFELVSAQYLHSPAGLSRNDVLRRAAQAVAPGGRLFVVGHADMHHLSRDGQLHYPDPEQLVDELGLPDEWEVEVLESLPRSVDTRDGQADINDAIVMLRRRTK